MITKKDREWIAEEQEIRFQQKLVAAMFQDQDRNGKWISLPINVPFIPHPVHQNELMTLHQYYALYSRMLWVLHERELKLKEAPQDDPDKETP